MIQIQKDGRRHRGRASLTTTLVTLGVATIALTSAGPASAAGSYQTTAAVNVRTGPTTSSAIIGTEPSGAGFTLLCQVQGGTNVNGNATWDQVRFNTDGRTGMITDYWTTTPSWNSYAPGTGACSGSTPPPAGPTVTTGVDMQAACSSQAGPSYSAIYRDRYNAFSWACVNGSSNTGIDVARACVDQQRLGANSNYRNASDAFSWYCLFHTPPASARSISYNPFAAQYSTQCTYLGEELMKKQTGMYMPVYGNAYQWGDQARAAGWTVGTAPVLYSIAVFPSGAFGSSNGHVGFVLGITASSLEIEDYNWNNSGATVHIHWVAIPGGTLYIYSDR